MSPRTRVALLVAVAGAAAVGATLGLTALSAQERESPGAAAPPSEPPAYLLESASLPRREAQALRQASVLYARGRRREAGKIFDRFESPEARIGAALAAWPRGTTVRLRLLAESHPRNAAVRLHLGLALLSAGGEDEALAAWREAARVQPDSPAAVRADSLLHPGFAPGLPAFVPSFAVPVGLDRLPLSRFPRLRDRARRGGARARLLYGMALQRLGRPLSARQQFELAAARASGDVDAQVAAAVGRFDKDEPAGAFGRLGPLTRRYPRAPIVRFHLGLLLLWSGQVDAGREQLGRARRLGPRTKIGMEANRWLRRLPGDASSR